MVTLNFTGHNMVLHFSVFVCYSSFQCCSNLFACTGCARSCGNVFVCYSSFQCWSTLFACSRSCGSGFVCYSSFQCWSTPFACTRSCGSVLLCNRSLQCRSTYLHLLAQSTHAAAAVPVGDLRLEISSGWHWKPGAHAGREQADRCVHL
jgi:hypothetical protein